MIENIIEVLNLEIRSENKVNYELKMQELIKEIKKDWSGSEKPRLLIHSCCAPCSSPVLEYLMEHFHLTVYFYNPNITEEDEYLLRKNEHIEYIKKNNYKIDFIDGDYNPRDDFFRRVKGYEDKREGGDRCTLCYNLRMEATAKLASEKNYNYFGTVLSISPLKNSSKINKIGKMLEEKYKVSFLYADFKKKERFKRSIVLSAEHNLYRQDYCGCIFSKIEVEEKRKIKEELDRTNIAN